jgi:LysM repeat protein
MQPQEPMWPEEPPTRPYEPQGPPPVVKPEPPAIGDSYTVAPGDSLSMIAAQFGLSTDELAVANNIDNPNWIYVGQVLMIP